jgi:hypothetical protein
VVQETVGKQRERIYRMKDAGPQCQQDPGGFCDATKAASAQHAPSVEKVSFTYLIVRFLLM